KLLELHFHIIGQADVETWDIQNANLVLTHGSHGHFHRAIFQTDTLTGESNDTGVSPLTGWQDHQANFAALRPFDQRNNIIKTPGNHVNHALSGLPHTDSTVAYADRFAFRRSATGHQGVDYGVVIVHLKHST